MTTNLERIRQMTADELAELLHNHDCECCVAQFECAKIDAFCVETIRQWLEQEVEE